MSDAHSRGRSPAWKVELAREARDRLVGLPARRRRPLAEALDRLAEEGPPAGSPDRGALEFAVGDDRLRAVAEPEARRIVVVAIDGPREPLPGETEVERRRRVGEVGPAARLGAVFTGFRDELRSAWRGLSARPGFAVVAFATLALGLAVNAAVFGLLREVALRPLPYADPDRLVVVGTPQQGGLMGVTWADFLDVHGRSDLLADVAATYRRGLAGDIVLETPSGPEAVAGGWATGGFFRVLGVEPALGRRFTAGPEARGEVILSHGAWQRRWGGDAGVVGESLTINGEPRLVVGVLPPGVGYAPAGPERELWVRAPDDARFVTDREAWVLEVVARLAAGATVEGAAEELRATAAEIAPLNADRAPGWTLTLEPLEEHIVGDVTPVLWVMLTAAIALMAIVSTNLAGLAFARNTARRRELAVRIALGAGRLRVVRQLVVESGLVALAGGLVGLALAPTVSRLALEASPVSLPRLAGAPGIDATVAGYTLALAVLATLLFSTYPAWRVTGGDMESELRDGGRSVAHGSARGWLLALEAALVAVLLVGAGLALRSLGELAAVDPGFDARGRVVLRVSMAAADDPVGAARRFFDRAEEEIESLPGVRAAGSVTNLPLYPGSWSGALYFADRATPPDTDPPQVDWEVATSGYFEAAGIPLIRGRVFDGTDRADTEPVTVINETMARRFWPDGNPIGRRISGNGPEGPWRRVVGVVGDVRQRGLARPPRGHMYVLHRQMYPFPERELVVATEGVPPESVVGSVRAVLREIEPAAVVDRVRLMDALVDEALSGARFGSLLLGFLAATGLLLGLTGVYAVVAWFVEQRVRELGIRMALGARGAEILRHAAGRGLVPVVSGAAAGMVVAGLGARAAAGFLYGVAPLDPTTYGAVLLVLSMTAAVAALIPARRAARLDPADALRET